MDSIGPGFVRIEAKKESRLLQRPRIRQSCKSSMRAATAVRVPGTTMSTAGDQP